MPKRPDSFLARMHEQQSRRAESAAALWLRMKGYRILARRIRTPHGEIDLIASKGNTLAFLEVKSRATQEEALASLTSDRRRHIDEAARLWLAARTKLKTHARRFDFVILSPGRLPRHVRDAWRLEG